MVDRDRDDCLVCYSEFDCARLKSSQWSAERPSATSPGQYQRLMSVCLPNAMVRSADVTRGTPLSVLFETSPIILALSTSARGSGAFRGELDKCHSCRIQVSENEHGRIRAAVAKNYLSPLGCMRKGRSRFWFSDELFWLTGIEFQPSSFRRGTYPRNHVAQALLLYLALGSLPFPVAAAAPVKKSVHASAPRHFGPSRVVIDVTNVENIVVTGRLSPAPVQPDPHPEKPLDVLRQYDAGASWGSTHPGQFCCASQYDTGLDGQAGR